ncbi:MAG: glycosyltransferase, partial [Candidatus Thorarchaeota archaeon]
VSVIMAVYNAELYLKESIESILNQTLKEFELIIINDGSTDNSLSIINSFDDNRIILINQKNAGPAVARNQGIDIAKGEFIAILDADDVALPERLERQYIFLSEHSQYLAIGSNAEIIDKNGEYIHSSNVRLNWISIKNNLPNTPFIHSTVMFRKEIVKLIGKYPDIPPSEDMFFFNNVSNIGQMTNLSDCLIRYRITPSAISRKSRLETRLMFEILKEFLKSGEISKILKQQLEAQKLKMSKEKKNFNYHILLAKRYLWGNVPNVKMAKSHLRQSLKFYIFRPEIWILFLISILPSSFVVRAYKTITKQNGY